MLCLSAALCLPFCPPNLFWLFCLLSDCVSESKSRNPCLSYLAFRLWCIYLYPHKFASSYEQVGSKWEWACIHHRHLLYRCTHANIFITEDVLLPYHITVQLYEHPDHLTAPPSIPSHYPHCPTARPTTPSHHPTIRLHHPTIPPSHQPTNSLGWWLNRMSCNSWRVKRSWVVMASKWERVNLLLAGTQIGEKGKSKMWRQMKKVHGEVAGLDRWSGNTHHSLKPHKYVTRLVLRIWENICLPCRTVAFPENPECHWT